MDLSSLEKLNQTELVNVNGGNPAAAAAVIFVAIVTGAYYLGYSDGKDDCPPPPCTE
jgi:lactobin A/cerein 7B family class IIb bacteriocin